MITLINSSEISQISPEEWLNSYETHFPTSLNNSLALIIDRNPANFSSGITNPGLIHYNCLDNKFIIDSAKLFDSLHNDLCFNPLLSAITENKIANLSPDEISLLSYFYLNALPFSVSLITRWFSDTGTEQSKAVKLANIVFMARTDKEDQEPDFIREIERLNNSKESKSVKDDFRNIPVELKEVFELMVKKPDYKLSYDCLGDISQVAETPVHEIYLGEIDETGFLIEDHAFIIAGLSVKVTELAIYTLLIWQIGRA
ncbi:MAG: hypothetical protein HGA37_08755, partial [Lentimicrobium sp.]|nr:hypothetical protein [Lentimicrobium sp.]